MAMYLGLDKVANGGGKGSDYDALPVGAVVEFDGDEIPVGYEEVDDENNYSYEETVIGTYLGKPLYRKVIEYSDRIATGTVQIPHRIDNIDFVPRCDYGVKWDGKNYPSPIIYDDYTKQVIVNHIDDSYIYLKSFGEVWDSYILRITLEYTKTTD